MDLRLSAEDEAFRDQVAARLRAILPDDIRDRQRRYARHDPPLADQRHWYAALAAEGWSVPNWPEAFGGTGWTPIQRFLFEDAMHAADAPVFHWTGTHMVGPVIYTFGSEAQRARFLPPIRTGETIWCQGFSEPGAGSDLASLRTKAERRGDSWVIDGQKIWTSGAYEADWGFFLVRTDPDVKPQAGLSFLLVDMKTPGITVRRIEQIDGEAHLCEVFLDEVVVPAENLVGEPGKGWTYAKFLLEHERTTSSFIFWTKRELARARRMAASRAQDADTPPLAARLAHLDADVAALEWSVLRVLTGDERQCSAAVAASILKIRGSELQQAVTVLQVDLLGSRALRFWGGASTDGDPDWPEFVPGRTANMLIARAATIYGGTMQVQKNILARTALGL